MSRLTREETAKPVSRHHNLRREGGQRKHNFPWLADYEQDWELYPVDPYSAESTEHTYIQSPLLGLSLVWPPYGLPSKN